MLIFPFFDLRIAWSKPRPNSITSDFSRSMHWSYRQYRCFLWAGLGLLLLSAGCGKKRLLVPVPGSPDLRVAHSEIYGIASWYGDPFHGERTSSGEVYDMHSMTAAHRTLPFRTVVRVHNLDNGTNVHVRVNDRGPFVKGRIIDLSRAAAEEIDMVRPGTARVRLEILRIEKTTEKLAVQVGSFTQESRARSLKRKLEGDYDPVTVSLFRTPRGEFHRVLVGDFPSRAKAMEVLEELRSKGFEGFVMRRD